MVLKAQILSPLETIYEESNSFIASTDRSSQRNYREETINGLISARVIPSVNIPRQRANETKPPVEVQFRDGSKRYIHPSTAETMMFNRRNVFNSSNENSSSNYRPLLRSNFNKRTFQQAKPLPLVLTIITEDDMKQAGITSSRSSSTSGSDISTLTPSPSLNSPLLSFDSLENSHEDALKQSSFTTDQSLSINNSSTSVLPFSTSSNHSLSGPSLKTSISSLHITLTNDENEKNSSIQSKLSDEIVQHAIQSKTTVAVENVNRSAFRPVLKSVQFKPRPTAIKTPVPSITYRKPNNSVQQQQRQQIIPYSQFYQQSVPSNGTSSIIQVSYQPPVKQKTVVVPEYSYDSIIANPIDFEVTMNPTANLKSLLQISPSHYPNLINYNVDSSFNQPKNSNRTFSFRTNPTMQGFNVTSNTVRDIPQLSSKYSSIPLLINIPVVSPTSNQKLLLKHSTALEKRLLNAGLSPETVVLYQRILDVAEYRQKNIFSTTQITDPYLNKPFT